MPPELFVSPSKKLPPVAHHHVPHFLAYALLLVVAGIIGVLSYAFLNSAYYTGMASVSYNSRQSLEVAAVAEAAPVVPVAPSVLSADYYNTVREGFVASGTTFVDADLSAMKLDVYVNGAVALEVPIKTIGREGSWWETPAGLYSIQAKEKNHFSSIGHVYQPWSMVFQGNFFIHGWPYEPDGTPVATTYSGGCVRLETADAKKVYDLVTVGTPVLVTKQNFSPDSFVYPDAASSTPSDITAQEYLVADLKNNVILEQKNIENVMPVGSVTDLVTSLVAAEYIDIDKTITIKQSMLVPTAKPRLTEGQNISVYNLLFPLLAESSNEAAEAIARTLGKTNFVTMMNAKAHAINMPNTTFVDASGTDEGNVSTATDLFSLLKYLYTNRSFVLNIASGKITSSVYGASHYTDLSNLNQVPNVTAGFVGGKIGTLSDGNETYAGVFNETINGETRPIAVIVLNSTTAYGDVATLLKQVEDMYK